MESQLYTKRVIAEGTKRNLQETCSITLLHIDKVEKFLQLRLCLVRGKDDSKKIKTYNLDEVNRDGGDDLSD